MDLIEKIAKRAYRIDKTYREVFEVAMDIVACHLNGCPLNLSKFLTMQDYDFMHDVVGIHRHINRNTGLLDDCFIPRCAALTPEDQKFLDRYKDAVDDAGPGATQAQINERMGL